MVLWFILNYVKWEHNHFLAFKTALKPFCKILFWENSSSYGPSCIFKCNVLPHHWFPPSEIERFSIQSENGYCKYFLLSSSQLTQKTTYRPHSAQGFVGFFFVFSCWQTFRPLWYRVISRPTSVILNMGGNGPSLDRSQQYHWERCDYMKLIFFPILEFTFHLQSVFMIRSPCTNLPFYCFHEVSFVMLWRNM